MKKNLGSLLLLLVTIPLFSSPLCDYNFSISNKSPYLKEGVEISFHATQKDKSAVMFFELSPKKSANYEIHLLQKKEDNSAYHDKKVLYTYLLYPLQEGNISVAFDFKVSLASDKSMEEFATGNRDVIKPMLTKESTIALTPLSLDVKKVDNTFTNLFGDYTLTHKLDKHSVMAYEQVNITYTIKGEGYPSYLEMLLPKIEGVKQFLEVEKKKNGTQHFHYALVGDKDFTIPEVRIECFSPSQEKSYTLSIPSQDISVKSIPPKALLDAQDSHPIKAVDWSAWSPYLNGFLLFVAGYLAASLKLFSFRKKRQTSKDPFKNKIKETKDAKSLLKLLLSTQDSRYKDVIEQLEASLYRDKQIAFKAIKEQLLKH